MSETFPNDDPTIKVYFLGLLALYRNTDNNTYQAAIHNAAEGHDFNITILVDSPGELTRPICLPSSIREDNVFLKVTGPRYPLSEHRAGDDFDFGHAINLDGPGFHDHKLNLDSPEKIKNSVFLNNGIFYTADNFPALIGHLGENAASKNVAFVIGANIYLTDSPTSQAFFTFRGMDGKTKSFQFINDGKTRYKVWVTNIDNIGFGGPSHFQHWYEVYSDPQGQRFDVEPNDPSLQGATGPTSFLPQFNHNTHDNPCNPVTLTKTAAPK